MGKIIDGKALAQHISAGIRERVEILRQRGIIPKLAVILVGDDPASMVYVNLKSKRASELGIAVEQYMFAADLAEERLVDLIDSLNRDESVHGILVQLPLPEQIDSVRVLARVSPAKDVDGFHSQNAGALLTGREGFLACTPKGIVALVKSTGTSIEGKRCVVVGRSNIVGKPAAILMLRENATVTICHSYTHDLGRITKEADILICAVGHAALITADMVKPGAVVIDVGQSRVNDKWHGDVDYEAVLSIASYITPVPGGVGPMTIIMLMDNTVEAAERSIPAYGYHGA
ncbi:MAG: tetrahydrofolate dehydrogenase/cyclohydrolase catalytic domain-containing protein [Candidatus Pelethousia sp.]|nr:tetrahydrofolate dehydrogenase/cyclohydrolase catalytic domain-containing protein [Candidatus Pelethousia sp.]